MHCDAADQLGIDFVGHKVAVHIVGMEQRELLQTMLARLLPNRMSVLCSKCRLDVAARHFTIPSRYFGYRLCRLTPRSLVHEDGVVGEAPHELARLVLRLVVELEEVYGSNCTGLTVSYVSTKRSMTSATALWLQVASHT